MFYKSILALYLSILLFPCLSTCQKEGKPLNKECQKDNDCVNAWSYCNETKKCECIEGFEQVDEICRPKQRFCPVIYTETDSHAVEPKEFCQAELTVKDVVTHNCTKKDENFCFIYPQYRLSESNQKMFGHCCPLPSNAEESLAPACPFTTIPLRTRCPDTRSLSPDVPVAKEMKRTCPLKTHVCVHNFVGNDIFLPDVCCPIPCRGSSKYFYVAGDGRCFSELDVNQTCIHHSQCPKDYKCKLRKREFICQ